MAGTNMFTRWRLGTPVRLSLLFVLVAGTLLGTLAWLWRSLLADERQMERTQQTDRLTSAGLLLTREIERTLASWEALAVLALQDEHALPPAGTALIVFDTEGVVRTAGVRPPFVPAVPPEPKPIAARLAAAAAAEFRLGDFASAATLYREAAATSHPATRAAALVGLARALRQQRQTQRALAVYDELAGLDDVRVGGFPATIVAHRERIALFRAAGDEHASREETERLTRALLNGTRPIDRATFDMFLESESIAAPEGPAVMLAEAAYELWARWHQQIEGRGTMLIGNQAVVTAWRTGNGVSAAVVGPSGALMSQVAPLVRELGVHVTMETASGEPVWGAPAPVDRYADRLLRESGLPWTLRLGIAADRESPGWASRRNLFSAGFLLMAVVIAAASYTVYRSVDRELAVARLQAEFVGAVSHEFRSPLTAMCHLTEVLEEGAASTAQVSQYYQALGRETRRLQGLVEHLLDFGRMQSGRREYRLEPLDTVTLAREVVEECRSHATSSSHLLECSASSDTLTVRADRDALALALRNLVDNAMKYSPAGSRVVVSVKTQADRVGIGVEDHGDGIPPDEQRGIFCQFVRGSSALARHVKGTGIGLTMAQQIVTAHGGRLDLRSEVGRGSTFTIWLPCDSTGPRTRVT